MINKLFVAKRYSKIAVANTLEELLEQGFTQLWEIERNIFNKVPFQEYEQTGRVKVVVITNNKKVAEIRLIAASDDEYQEYLGEMVNSHYPNGSYKVYEINK